MKLSEYKIEDLKKEIKTPLDYLVKDFNASLDKQDSNYMISRIAQFLNKKADKKMEHFIQVCRYMVENEMTYRKITVATIKTAWCKVHEQE